MFATVAIWLVGSAVVFAVLVLLVLFLGDWRAALVVAGLLAAAMGTHASAINSLASASTNDFYAPLTGQRDPARLLKVGRLMTLIWAIVLVVGAMLSVGHDLGAATILELTLGAYMKALKVSAPLYDLDEDDLWAAVPLACQAITPTAAG